MLIGYWDRSTHTVTAMKSETRLRAVFSGHVQGVGFRFTTVRLAGRYDDVAGYVRNVADGTVELVAEGSRASLSTLLGDVTAAMAGHIAKTQETWEEPVGRFSGFQVRFWGKTVGCALFHVKHCGEEPKRRKPCQASFPSRYSSRF